MSGRVPVVVDEAQILHVRAPANPAEIECQ